MATRNQVIRELKRIGIDRFNNEYMESVTFYDHADGIDVDFWNIMQVCKSQHHGHTTSRGFSVRFLTKKHDRIHCASVYRDIRDFSDITLQDLKQCKDAMDLKALISAHKALGLRVA